MRDLREGEKDIDLISQRRFSRREYRRFLRISPADVSSRTRTRAFSVVLIVLLRISIAPNASSNPSVACGRITEAGWCTRSVNLHGQPRAVSVRVSVNRERCLHK